MDTTGTETQTGQTMRGRSIGRRISTLAAISVLTAVLLVTVTLTYIGITSDFETRKRSLETTGFVYASAVADHMAAKDTRESLLVLRSIGRIPEIRYAAVLDKEGRAFAAFGNAVVLDPGKLRSDPGIVDALGKGVYPVAVDIVKSGETIGRMLLIADISDLRRQLLFSLLTGLAAAGLAVAISLAIARRLRSQITAPLHSLTAMMQEIGETRAYDRKVETLADGETGLLIDSFNTMLTEIMARDTALERNRQTLEATVERRTAELRLARDAAETANEAKSGFLATMSHEIRTPLNGLMVMAELLAAGGLDQRQQRYAEVIVKSGQSLLTIINDILDLSKIEAGKLELERLPLDPAGIADDVISLFWEKASSKGLDLAGRISADVPRAILGDPVRLNQILSNLVNNALKFTEAGQVMVSMHYDRGMFTMAVTDSGIGIPQKKLNVLFEAFSQADQSVARKFGGTGLGLAICKRLAEAMGGAIGVASNLGRGSTFWVRIPVELADHAPRYVAGPAMCAGIAVDGLASQSALGTALAAAGFEVKLIDTETAGCDVVFCNAGNLAALRHGTGRQPRIICLGSLGDPHGETAIADGRADDLIILPLRQQDIADMITRIHTGTLRGRSLLQRVRHETADATRFTGRRILVADDNAVNREVIIEVLRQLDVSVQAATNGREAVEAWLKDKPDLIFMDCSMPEMDGYEATREIRAHEALAIDGGRTPVIALTAQVAGTDSEAWRKAGMNAYMTKPFTLKQITACLAEQFTGLPMPAETIVAPPTDEIIDAAIIDELRSIGGNDALFRRVLDLFATRVPPAVDKVAELTSSDDLTALADAAHALKSMCANIGAHRAVQACHDMERAARTSTGFDAGVMAATIMREVQYVMKEVERLRAA